MVSSIDSVIKANEKVPTIIAKAISARMNKRFRVIFPLIKNTSETTNQMTLPTIAAKIQIPLILAKEW